MANAKVLVVEDDSDTRQLYCELLEAESISTLAAGTGQAGLAHLAGPEPIQAILLDLSLPDMTGMDFVEKLRKDPKRRDVKVIVVSGWDNLRAKAEALGVWAYLRKPFSLPSLTSLIHSL